MKYFICSDIHGSVLAVEKLVENFYKLECDKMILLGDVLYHGPRNPLPQEYEPKVVAKKLNLLADRIIACRGNCDSEVDQMILDFPMLADNALICDNGIRIFATHGHIYSPQKMPPLCSGDIFLYGHTHVQKLEKTGNGITLCNPGSPSLPKENSPSGFAVLVEGKLVLHEL